MDTNFVDKQTVIQADWLNDVNDFVYQGKVPTGNTIAISVDSIAALKLLDKNKFTKAIVYGYYTKGDGGGGTYYYDPSDIVSTDNGGTIIVATDAARWKLQDVETISVKQFGAKGDGVADDSVAIQNAFNVVTTGQLHVPKGTYKITTGLTLNAPQLVLEGDGMYSTELFWAGSVAGPFITISGGNFLHLRNIKINGWSGSGNFFRSNDIGIVTAASINAENTWFQGFQYLLQWTGGFYHKFIGCRFNKANKALYQFSANNLSIISSRVAEVDYFVNVQSGAGPVAISECALEKWTSVLLEATGGASPAITITNNYIENYPTTAAGNGLAKAFYQGALLTSGFEAFNITGNMGTLNGVRRIIANGGINTKSIVAVGNEWQYQKSAGSDTDFFYQYQALEQGLFKEYAKDILVGQTGGFTPAYRTGTVSFIENVTGVDAVTQSVIIAEPTWTSISLLNGWINADATNYQSASYKKIGNRVFLRGYITGAAATSSTIFTLPSGYYDDKFNVEGTTSLSGTPTAINLRLLNNGNMLIQNTSYTTTGPFSLDGIAFFVD